MCAIYSWKISKRYSYIMICRTVFEVWIFLSKCSKTNHKNTKWNKLSNLLATLYVLIYFIFILHSLTNVGTTHAFCWAFTCSSPNCLRYIFLYVFKTLSGTLFISVPQMHLRLCVYEVHSTCLCKMPCWVHWNNLHVKSSHHL